MHEIGYLIERIAPGLYLVCAAGVFWGLWRWFVARRRLWAAEFELEREMANAQQARSITWSIGIIEIAAAIFAIANVIAPMFRADELAANTPTTTQDQAPIVQQFMTSTPGGTGKEVQELYLTVTAQVAAGNGGPLIFQTPLPSATPVGTILPNAPAAIGCKDASASLQIPANGQVIFDSLNVVGTANIPNFGSYKLELNGPSTGGQFAPIGGSYPQAVKELGALGQVALGPYQPGSYQFRLAVFDTIGNLKSFCVVNVDLRLPPPTQTPIASKQP